MIARDITDKKYQNYLSIKGDKDERIFGGYPCSFRQWRAEGTHCKFIHSYVISFRVKFDREVKAWFKSRANLKQRSIIKKWFKDTFQYKTFIAEDDPFLQTFKHMHTDYFIKLEVLPQVGCERFAKFVYDNFQKLLDENNIDMKIKEVEVFEHNKNSAIYKG